jgi:hypothetical protein
MGGGRGRAGGLLTQAGRRRGTGGYAAAALGGTMHAVAAANGGRLHNAADPRRPLVPHLAAGPAPLWQQLEGWVASVHQPGAAADGQRQAGSGRRAAAAGGWRLFRPAAAIVRASRAPFLPRFPFPRSHLHAAARPHQPSRQEPVCGKPQVGRAAAGDPEQVGRGGSAVVRCTCGGHVPRQRSGPWKKEASDKV